MNHPTPQVTVYTLPNCIQCTLTIRHLNKQNIPHHTINLADHPTALDYIRNTLGYQTAPIVHINKHQHWSGFQPDRLNQLPTLLQSTRQQATMTVDQHGTKEWRDEHGQRHRENDQPAVEHPDGSKEWWVDGQKHRDGDQPAVVWTNGRKEWWVDGRRHRDNDQPAVEYPDGTKEWWIDGKHITDTQLLQHAEINQTTRQHPPGNPSHPYLPEHHINTPDNTNTYSIGYH